MCPITCHARLPRDCSLSTSIGRAFGLILGRHNIPRARDLSRPTEPAPANVCGSSQAAFLLPLLIDLRGLTLVLFRSDTYNRIHWCETYPFYWRSDFSTPTPHLDSASAIVEAVCITYLLNGMSEQHFTCVFVDCC